MAVEKRKGTRHEVLAMEINLITFLLINNAPWSFARYQFSVYNFFKYTYFIPNTNSAVLAENDTFKQKNITQ